MFTKVIVVLLILGSNSVYCGWLTEYSNCIVTVATDDLPTCLTNNPIVGVTTNTTTIDFYSNPEVICSKQTEYIKLIQCFVTATSKCATDDDLRSLVVSKAKYEDSLKYFCGRVSSFNGTCYLGAVPEVTNCTVKKVSGSSLGADPSIDDFKSYTCKFADNVIGCYSESTVLGNCMETKTTIVEVSKRQKTPACGSTSLYYTTSLMFLSILMSKLFSAL